MASSFQYFPDHDLIYIRYAGTGRAIDYLRVVAGIGYSRDIPKDANRLVDLRELTGFSRDSLLLMKIQARIVEQTLRASREYMSVVVAPGRAGQEIAGSVFKSWQQLDTPVIRRMVTNMQEAGALLGLDAAALDEILAHAG